jgi:hypothetical protein
MQDSSKPVLPPGMHTLETRLNAIVDGTSDPADLTIIYDDVGGLEGGVRTTVHGNGRVEQEVVAPEKSQPTAHDLSIEEIRSLAKLLVDIQAWEQETPEQDVPVDEGRTTLTIKLGAMESRIWERHNDVPTNDRIGKVLRMVREYAW